MKDFDVLVANLRSAMKELITATGVSQCFFARCVGITPAAVYQWKHSCLPSTKTVERIVQLAQKDCPEEAKNYTLQCRN